MKFIDKIDIKETSDGSVTLIHPILSDSYHSMQGAIEEALHVYINPNITNSDTKHLKILEMGFGSGLNALLSAIEASQKGVCIEYHTIELYPVSPIVAQKLNYTDIIKCQLLELDIKSVFEKIHAAEWDVKTKITDNFILKKIYGSFISVELENGFDRVFWDAFSPDTQPELWSEELFSKVYGILSSDATLTTYSAKGDVKQALRAAGFTVKRLKGFGTKRHMIYAKK